MEIIKIEATPRNEVGKSPSSRLRRTGKIPAVAYGKELKSLPVAIEPKQLIQVLSSDHGANSVVELAIEGNKNLMVMVRDYAYHPVTRELLHADFLQIKLDEPVEAEVPFRCTGKAKGIVLGGILQQIFRKIPVRCLPEKIPSVIELDVSDLGMGESYKANQLKMPEGVVVRLPQEQTIVVVAAPEKASPEEEAKTAAQAAPAAGAAAPAAAAAKATPAAAPAKGKDKK